MPREVLEFTPNVPVRVALAYAAGKTIESRFGERVMFTLSDGRVMFLDLGAAQKVNELKPRPNQPFYIVKNLESKRGSPVEWRAWPSPDADCGEQSNGTFVVPRDPERALPAPAPAAARITTPPMNPSSNANGNNKPPEPGMPGPHQGWALFLLAQTEALIDIYAALLEYSSKKHGEAVKPDDVRTLLTTCWIAQTKNGAPRVG